MNIVLLADGIVGLAITRYLIENYKSDISLVVTTQENEILGLVKSNGLDGVIFESEEAVKKTLESRDVDIGILAWWPYVIKDTLIDLPLRGFINTHPSFLPFNRGKHPSFWVIVEQVPYGVTIHNVNQRLDAGEILAQTEIDYDWCDTGETLYLKARQEMIELFVNLYPSLRHGVKIKTVQDLLKGSFHLSSEIEEATKIDLDETYLGRELINKLRAKTFTGFKGCWFEDCGEKYEITIQIKKSS